MLRKYHFIKVHRTGFSNVHSLHFADRLELHRYQQPGKQPLAALADEPSIWQGALVAYIKQNEAHGEKMRGDVLFALGEGQGGPSIEKIVWYMLDRAVLISTKSGR